VDGPVAWLCCAAEALPFRDGRFDLVVSALSLRHWYDPGRGLAEAGRVTAPGGTLVIADALIGDAPIGDAPNTPARRRRPRWQAARLPADLRRVLRADRAARPAHHGDTDHREQAPATGPKSRAPFHVPRSGDAGLRADLVPIVQDRAE
jgi:SAM-dependent methyltransferase